uniref:Uncharacterized protein n=1 Tax=Anguilla anguilla TaxID=7936 RepID=A0A0E9WSH9_ANGAN
MTCFFYRQGNRRDGQESPPSLFVLCISFSLLLVSISFWLTCFQCIASTSSG